MLRTIFSNSENPNFEIPDWSIGLNAKSEVIDDVELIVIFLCQSIIRSVIHCSTM